MLKNYTYLLITSSICLFSATTFATAQERDKFMKEYMAMKLLPASSDAQQVKEGKARFAIGGRTIAEIILLNEKIKDKTDYIPTANEQRLVMIANAAADKIANNKDRNPEKVFSGESPNDKNIRILMENPNVRFDVTQGTLAGTHDGLKIIQLKEIFQLFNKVLENLAKNK